MARSHPRRFYLELLRCKCPVVAEAGENAAQSFAVDRRIEANLLARSFAFFARPESTVAIGREQPLATLGGDQQQLVFTNDDAKIIEPGVVGPIMTRIGCPIRGNVEFLRAGIFFARIPVAAIKEFRDYAVLTMNAQWK